MKISEAILVSRMQFEIQECPVPEPKDHEILMKVEYVGMCGSDIHGFEFGPFIPPKDPNQKIGLGHEVAGEVVKVGSKVTRFKAGDKVLIEPGVPDDKCEYCRTGRYNICPDVDFMATQPNYKGALTQYMTHPEEWTYHIPEGMTTMEAALVEPAAVRMHAAILGGAQLGKSIVILGGGTIGLMVLQACKSLGATDITVVDIMQNRLDLALKLGASRVINGKEQDTVALLRSPEYFGDHGCELVFEAAGSVFTAQQAVQIVARGGKIMMVGTHHSVTATTSRRQLRQSQAVSSMLRIWLQTSMITKMFSRHLWTLSTPKRKPIWLRALSRQPTDIHRFIKNFHKER